jgi:hypothetical protein
MKKLLALGLVSSLIGMIVTLPGSQGRGASEGVQDRFVGAWRLASLEEQGADGNIPRSDCTGLLIYTRDGPPVGPGHGTQPAGTNSWRAGAVFARWVRGLLWNI